MNLWHIMAKQWTECGTAQARDKRQHILTTMGREKVSESIFLWFTRAMETPEQDIARLRAKFKELSLSEKKEVGGDKKVHDPNPGPGSSQQQTGNPGPFRWIRPATKPQASRGRGAPKGRGGSGRALASLRHAPAPYQR